MNNFPKYYYKILHLSLLLIRRDFNKLILSTLSLFIGTLVLTFILSAQGSLGQYIQSETKTLVGGDVTVSLSSELKKGDSKTFDYLQEQSVNHSLKITTNVLARSEQSTRSSVLSFVTAVSPQYPVYGDIRVSTQKWSPLTSTEIYVEQNLLSRLELTIGDSISIGKSSYRISGVLESLPDQLVSGFSFGPRILLSQEAFILTGIDKKASRISYRYDLALPEGLISNSIKKDLVNELKPLSGRVNFADEGAGSELAVLENIKKFLVILSVLALFLVVINIRSSMTYLFLDYKKTISLYKVLGMSPIGAIFIFIFVLLILALFASVLGVVTGNMVFNHLLPIAEDIITANLVPAFLFNNFLSVFFVILTMTIIGAFSILINISKISPKEVFSTLLKSQVPSIKSWEFLVAVFSIIILCVIVWTLSGSILLASIAVSSLSITFVLLTLLLVLCSALIYKLRFFLPHYVRYVSNFINTRGFLGISNYAALVLALTILFSITGLENSLQESIQNDLSRTTPNLYIIDVQVDQQEDLQQIFLDYASDLNRFPNVRGKLLYIDETDVQKVHKQNREYTRSFNNTYRTNLIAGELIVEGLWHGTTKKGSVSVDENIANDLDIQIGSVVTFGIQGKEISAEVTSLRSTGDTNLGVPFFYFVFSPDVLEKAPQSSFGFSFIDKAKIPRIQNTIAQNFPNISTIPTGDLLAFAVEISALFSNVLVIMSLPALALGSLLIWSQLLYATRERIYDLKLFKIFGMKKKSVLLLYCLEMVILVLGSVVFALLLSRVVVWGIFKFTFELPTKLSLEPLFYIISASSILIVAVLVVFFTKKLYSNSARNYFSNK